MAPRLLRIPEAAEVLGCTPRQVYRMVAAGRLKVVDIGLTKPRCRIAEAELERYVKANTYGRTAS